VYLLIDEVRLVIVTRNFYNMVSVSEVDFIMIFLDGFPFFKR